MADQNRTTNLLLALRADYCTAGCNPSICMCSLAEEAADEIERLRAALAEVVTATDAGAYFTARRAAAVAIRET